MNYTGRYGMEFNPFIKNSKEILVETSDYRVSQITSGFSKIGNK